MKAFLECSSVQTLRELAQNPIDLTQPQVLSSERIQRFSSACDAFVLSYATERVDDHVLTALQELAEERALISHMEAMQRGDIVNVIHGYASESRPALHTATRAWVDHKPLQGVAEEIARKSESEGARLVAFLEKVRRSFSTIVQIGIGGSELGPKALYYALKGICDSEKHVYFVSNIDPDEAVQVLQRISCRETLVVVVSKSGTTQETAVNEEFFREYFSSQGCRCEDHFIAVTCEGSPMDDTSKYLEVFHLWDSIGGRFSSTSMVGGVVLGFAFGFKVFEQLLQGASFMDTLALHPTMTENLSLLSALLGIWNRNFLGFPTVAVVPYSAGLKYFPAHLQQCSMESNGKGIDQEGRFVQFATAPVLWGEVGTNSQHSFFQCLHQGIDVIPVEFIGFLKSQKEQDLCLFGSTSTEKLFANMLAQSIALAKGAHNENPNRSFSGNRPSSLLVAQQLTPYIVGALLAFYEHKIAFQGFCWGINSFDQEGVSLGKALTNQILTTMHGGDADSAKEAHHLLALFQQLS